MTTLRNRSGERLDATFHPGRPDDPRIVAIGHGVSSHKDRPWLLALSQALSAAGVASVRLSFAGNGGSDGRFEDATISKEIDDLGAVLDALGDRHVIYAGHSMGAAVGTLRAARDPRIVGLVSLAGMVHIAAFMQRVFGHLRPDVDCMLDKPQCPLTSGFLADARAHGDTLRAAAQVRVPWLLVHGTADELVPLQDAVDAHRTAGGRPTLIEIEGADHRFTGHEDAMANAVVAWLRQVSVA